MATGGWDTVAGTGGTLRHLRAADYRTMPWKNGLGETVEIGRAARPGAGDYDFDWRISVAPVVADGAFSRFEGIDRTIMVIEGAGMELSLAGRAASPRRLMPFQPLAYDGGLAIEGRLLAGPVRDFNVMTRRDLWRSVLAVEEGSSRIAASGGGAGTVIVAYALSGSWRIAADSHPALTLAAGESIHGTGLSGLAVAPDGGAGRLALALLVPFA